MHQQLLQVRRAVPEHRCELAQTGARHRRIDAGDALEQMDDTRRFGLRIETVERVQIGGRIDASLVCITTIAATFVRAEIVSTERLQRICRKHGRRLTTL